MKDSEFILFSAYCIILAAMVGAGVYCLSAAVAVGFGFGQFQYEPFALSCAAVAALLSFFGAAKRTLK